MNQYPLYPYLHRKLCLKIMLATLFLMLVTSILVSFLYPSPIDGFKFFQSFILKKFIIFSLLLFCIYGLFSYFFFKTLVVE